MKIYKLQREVSEMVTCEYTAEVSRKFSLRRSDSGVGVILDNPMTLAKFSIRRFDWEGRMVVEVAMC